MKKLLALFAVCLLFACADKKEKEAKVEKETPAVITVNYPLHYFADRIGADLIRLEYVIPKDLDPAYWTPDEVALTKYQTADVIYKNGADYAKWINNVSLPSSKLVNTMSGSIDKLIKTKQMKTHSHGPEGEHEHAELAFTSWLDFEIGLAQAEAIKSDLEKRIPTGSEKINENFEKLKVDLNTLHNEMKTAAARLEGELLVASHPVYQYLEQAYGLKIESVHFEPDEMPSHKQWHDLEHLFHQQKNKIMLWEDEPNDEIQAELDKRGIQAVVFNPCGNQPAQGDFLATMQINIKNVKGIALNE